MENEPVMHSMPASAATSAVPLSCTSPTCVRGLAGVEAVQAMAGSHPSGMPLALVSIRSSESAQASRQSNTVSPSPSASTTPQPQAPGCVLLASLGQPSLQFGDPSESLSVSATPQPQ